MCAVKDTKLTNSIKAGVCTEKEDRNGRSWASMGSRSILSHTPNRNSCLWFESLHPVTREGTVDAILQQVQSFGGKTWINAS